MRTVYLHADHDVRVEEAPEPVLLTGPDASGRDAIVRVVASCVCGSDLWGYRGIRQSGEARPMGHEFVGVVEAVGDAVATVKAGDFVIAPFYICCGTCLNCRNGVSTSCLNGGWWGGEVKGEGRADAGQGERVRVPLADGTLVVVPGGEPDPALIPGLLTLSDVMCTGHHAAVSGGVAPVRSYIEELLPEVLDGRIRPGLVFDLELPLSEAASAYAAMDERRAVKVLLRP
ncbi:MAG TPA: alcohol dehydrogenase catalytic domain-containing protein [Actinoplanes sp.]|nr:alcohol dehydrogenase catalytic domain-containing protein [Actinoplanes sp.]